MTTLLVVYQGSSVHCLFFVYSVNGLVPCVNFSLIGCSLISEDVKTSRNVTTSQTLKDFTKSWRRKKPENMIDVLLPYAPRPRGDVSYFVSLPLSTPLTKKS